MARELPSENLVSRKDGEGPGALAEEGGTEKGTHEQMLKALLDTQEA